VLAQNLIRQNEKRGAF